MERQQRPVVIGKTISHYKILEKLGSGGMGVVYRARDLHLDRMAAIKILGPESMSDPKRRSRFVQEARLASSLNHSNIVAIYDIDTEKTPSEEIHYIAMEFISGTTLGSLIEGKKLPLPEVLSYAVQIADALSRAHGAGIIHRDLKPANIMITGKGQVKIVDFGLAKLTESTSGASGVSTLSYVTEFGKVVGTVPYMSPEQVEGKPLDFRSDLFSFGVVLYEMLAGRRAFPGDSNAAVLSAVLLQDPEPVSGFRPDIPLELDRVLQKLLQKDPHQRYQHTGDLLLDLQALQKSVTNITKSGKQPTLSVAGAKSGLWRKGRWVAGILAIAFVTGGAFVFMRWIRVVRHQEPEPLQASFGQLTGLSGVEQYPSVSPDGKWVVYSGEETGNRDIYLQSASGQIPINLTKDSTADDDEPAFSRDGERIAFRSSREGGGIFVMGSTGEAVRRVTRTGFNPTWSSDGTKLAFTTENVQLVPMNPSGKGQSELWVADVNTGETRRLGKGDMLQPSWSPHDLQIAFAMRYSNPQQMDIWTMPAAGGEPTPVIRDAATDWCPVWSPDGKYIYFTSDRGGSMNLWRVPVDETSGKPVGAPEAITTPAPFLAHPSISGDGKRIAYSSVLETQNIQRITFDHSLETVKGEPTWITTGSRRWSSPDVSSDGQWLAFYTRVQPEGDLYVVRTDGTALRQLTSDEATDRVPRWSPDGNWIAYFSNRSGRLQIWKVRPDGSEHKQVTDNPDALGIVAWAPDGSRIAVSDNSGTYVFDPNQPWQRKSPQVPQPGEAALRPFNVNDWSPDGKHLAGQIGYSATGIVTFSFKSGLYERLTDYGEWPVWLADSRRILFVYKGKELFVVDSESKKAHKIFSVPRDVIGPPRLSRDSHAIYFTRRVTEADIWLVTLH